MGLSYAKEIVTISSAVSAQCTNVTDRQTDRQRNGNIDHNRWNRFENLYSPYEWRCCFNRPQQCIGKDVTNQRFSVNFYKTKERILNYEVESYGPEETRERGAWINAFSGGLLAEWSRQELSESRTVQRCNQYAKHTENNVRTDSVLCRQVTSFYWFHKQKQKGIRMTLTLIQPAFNWTHWATLRRHSCLSRAATSASSHVSVIVCRSF